jgi:hypothetical protein
MVPVIPWANDRVCAAGPKKTREIAARMRIHLNPCLAGSVLYVGFIIASPFPITEAPKTVVHGMQLPVSDQFQPEVLTGKDYGRSSKIPVPARWHKGPNGAHLLFHSG